MITGSDATFVDVGTCIFDIKPIAKEVDVGRLYGVTSSIHVIAEATETLGYVELIVKHACFLQHIYLCISCYVEDSESFVITVGLYISCYTANLCFPVYLVCFVVIRNFRATDNDVAEFCIAVYLTSYYTHVITGTIKFEFSFLFYPSILDDEVCYGSKVSAAFTLEC